MGIICEGRRNSFILWMHSFTFLKDLTSCTGELIKEKNQEELRKRNGNGNGNYVCILPQSCTFLIHQLLTSPLILRFTYLCRVYVWMYVCMYTGILCIYIYLTVMLKIFFFIFGGVVNIFCVCNCKCMCCLDPNTYSYNWIHVYMSNWTVMWVWVWVCTDESLQV